MKKTFLICSLMALLAGCSEASTKTDPPPPPYTDEMVMEQLSEVKSLEIRENTSGDSIEVYRDKKSNRNMFQGDSNLSHSHFSLMTRNGKFVLTLESMNLFNESDKKVKLINKDQQVLAYVIADSPFLVQSRHLNVFDNKNQKIGYIEVRNERSFDEFTYYDEKTKKKMYTYDGGDITFYGGDNMLRMQSFLLVSFFRFTVFDEINNQLL
jgi:hypothetical protein